MSCQGRQRSVIALQVLQVFANVRRHVLNAFPKYVACISLGVGSERRGKLSG